MAVRKLTELEEQFKKDAEREFPGYYDFKPMLLGFVNIETRNAFEGYKLGMKVAQNSSQQER
jgi:hypothetical protein